MKRVSKHTEGWTPVDTEYGLVYLKAVKLAYDVRVYDVYRLPMYKIGRIATREGVWEAVCRPIPEFTLVYATGLETRDEAIVALQKKDPKHWATFGNEVTTTSRRKDRRGLAGRRNFESERELRVEMKKTLDKRKRDCED